MTAYSASRLEGPGEFRMVDIPALDVPEGWAVVRVSFTGVCGSDFPIVDGAHPRAVFPLVLGHEITGVVHSPGKGALSVGTRVAVNPLLSCGICGACLKGLEHLCRRLRLLGIDAPGSLATLVAAPPENLVPFRSGIAPIEAAFAEPLAVAVHAVRRSRLAGGESVMIFGAGPIGLLVALVARQLGAVSITIVEPSAARREVGTALGFVVVEPAAVVSARKNDDKGPAIVFDCAGHHSVATQATQVAPVRGRIVIVAVHGAPVEFDLRELAFAEQEVIGVRVYASEDFADAVRLIEEGSLRLDRIPVEIFPLEEAHSAVEQARSAGGAVKILVKSGE